MPYINIFLTLLMLVIVDQVYEGHVYAEIVTTDEDIEYIHIPRELIPCNVEEGDKIHLSQSGETVMISCTCKKGILSKCQEES